MLVAEDADARRAEPEETPLGRSKAEPARRQHPKDMAAGKHDRLVIRCAKAPNDAIGAGADLAWLLAVRAPVAEQAPAGAVGEDLAALAPLVVAVVPFEQVGIKLGGVAEPSECAGASRTLKGTGENPIKLKSLKTLVEPSGLAFALLRERNIRASRMLAACAPFGFAMANEIDARKHGDSNPRLRRQWGAEDGSVLPRLAPIWICDQRMFGAIGRVSVSPIASCFWIGAAKG